jgi:hypothetical protein
VPLGANFEPLIGGGRSLFPQSAPPRCEPLGTVSSYRDVVRTNDELSANAHAWFVDASASLSKSNSFDYYRAFQIVSDCQLDESTPMSPPPTAARYYASQVFFGHSYTLVIRGEQSRVNSAIGAGFGSFGGSVTAMEQRYQVIARSAGHGLTPVTDKALFAPPELIASNYRVDPGHQPDAIIVHYRVIPQPPSSVQ